ncbi:hypothetical protein SAMN05443245_3745 [Paraburkholderia fungorum]|uniref:Uncharacterized protein n=1 Tax=Paraburkholderia fungorum TaxID=134537 RepID=A0A1H1HCH4_9BURK|nr:hypothetical protein [Paraburkholderia fungorum]SDR23071.1 hypothetical protein SAMN05443245_3745 [Paraburkholderia fungorum]
MNSHRLSVLPATAVALLAFGGTASAAGLCSNQTLRGPYGFSAKGEVLGLLDANKLLHPFTTPVPLDDVALVNFDGNGHIARTDFGNVNGTPKGGQVSFNPAQNGSYKVNSDCTGNMTIKYDNGVELDLQMVVDGDASDVQAIIATEYVPGAANAADGTVCETSGVSGCWEGVQVSLEGKKVLVYGFR